jgi:alkylated DNA repair dioxygenase AlkB
MFIVRGWRSSDHLDLFDEIRERFTYVDGDIRAAGYVDDEVWLAPLLDALEQLLEVRFTTVAFQAYRTGEASCPWHADQNFDIQTILSLGATRTFAVRRAGEEQRYELESGDLVVMPSGDQAEWEHCVPAEPTVTGERISLVFRTNKGN